MLEGDGEGMRELVLVLLLFLLLYTATGTGSDAVYVGMGRGGSGLSCSEGGALMVTMQRWITVSECHTWNQITVNGVEIVPQREVH